MLQEEIKREDQRIFWREFLQPRRIILHVLYLCITLGIWSISFPFLGSLLVSLAAHLGFSEAAARRKRFKTKRFAELWNGCRDRYYDFRDGISKLQKAGIVDMEGLPSRIEEISVTLYNALRRADLLLVDIDASEGKNRFQPGAPMFPPTDPQTQALYQLAEKSRGDYRNSYNELVAGIQRTEAQATVFIHTLDVLRVKMHSYRLIGKNPSLNSHDFMSALAEAKVTLQSIDTALDELDLSVYPKSIAVVQQPPSLRAEIIEMQEVSNHTVNEATPNQEDSSAS
ncbi:MAG: hypothetical protein ACK53G_03525 [Armatimonadota bacterium]|jgi:hypothetical protein